MKRSLTFLGGKLRLVQGDITTLKVDAIVNAANESLLCGGGVDGAIHQAAGPELLRFNKTLGGCPVGHAKLSPGFNLPAKYVISTVGPIGEKPDLLKMAYQSCLKLAIDNNIRSIAFPNISTGVYGYPKESAANLVTSLLKDQQAAGQLDHFDQIVLCTFDNENYDLYEKYLNQKFQD
ncbi:hypothetical protein MP228_004709 [Amoeboaphelidium protococcarum]|nr:hypothetical protein MP228_004709 [Amoeboaphelidium protococcarum]